MEAGFLNEKEGEVVVETYSVEAEAKSSLFTVACSGFALISDGLQVCPLATHSLPLESKSKT